MSWPASWKSRPRRSSIFCRATGVTEKKTHSSSIPEDVAVKVRKQLKGASDAEAAAEAAADAASKAKDAAAKAARSGPAVVALAAPPDAAPPVAKGSCSGAASCGSSDGRKTRATCCARSGSASITIDFCCASSCRAACREAGRAAGGYFANANSSIRASRPTGRVRAHCGAPIRANALGTSTAAHSCASGGRCAWRSVARGSSNDSSALNSGAASVADRKSWSSAQHHSRSFASSRARSATPCWRSASWAAHASAATCFGQNVSSAASGHRWRARPSI